MLYDGAVMHPDVAKRVISVIAKTQHLEESKITMDSSYEELGIDSLDGVNILFGLENEFDIQIPDDSAKQIRSVRQTIEGVEQLVTQKADGTG